MRPVVVLPRVVPTVTPSVCSWHVSSVRNGASKRLVNLSKDVRAAKEQLQERLDLATRLLQLAEKARSLETDKEKVQPYYASSMPETQDPDEVMKTPAEEAAEESKWMRNMLANDGYSEVTSKAIMEVGDPALMRQLDNFYKKCVSLRVWHASVRFNPADRPVVLFLVLSQVQPGAAEQTCYRA